MHDALRGDFFFGRATRRLGWYLTRDHHYGQEIFFAPPAEFSSTTLPSIGDAVEANECLRATADLDMRVIDSRGAEEET